MRGRLGLWRAGGGGVVSSPGTPPGQDKVYQVIAQFKLLLGRRGHWEGRASHDLGAALACRCVWHSGGPRLMDRSAPLGWKRGSGRKRTFDFSVFASLERLEKDLEIISLL